MRRPARRRDAVPRVAILMHSTMTNEPRVRREAETFHQMGLEVVAIGTRPDGSVSKRDRVDDFDVVRIDLWDIRLLDAVKRWVGRLRRRRSEGETSAGVTGRVGLPTSPDRWDPLGDLRDVVFLVSSFLAFSWRALRSGADVLHPHDPPPLLAAVLVGSILRRPVVYESHEYWMAKHPGRPVSRWLIRTIERFGCRRADLVIVSTETIADLVAADYEVVRPTVVVNVPRVSPVAAVEPHEGPLRLLYHGILVPGRGIEVLIEALTLMSEPAEAVIRGPGPLREALAALIAERGLTGRCHLADPLPLDELIVAAAESDVGVLPLEAKIGYDLAFPNKLPEYMAAGLAVVASDFGELRRIVSEGDIGVLVPPGDPAALARAFDSLARDRDHLEGCRRRALRLATEKYNWSAHSHVMRESYERLLEGS